MTAPTPPTPLPDRPPSEGFEIGPPPLVDRLLAAAAVALISAVAALIFLIFWALLHA